MRRAQPERSEWGRVAKGEVRVKERVAGMRVACGGEAGEWGEWGVVQTGTRLHVEALCVHA